MRATLAVLRMFAAVLKDNTAGVTARLAATELLPGDAAPRAPKAILCEADDNVSIREDPQSGWPLLVVLEDEQGEELDPEALVNYRDARVRVVIAVVDEPAVQSEGFRNAKYLQQAIVESITHGLLAEDKIETAGVLGDIAILQATQLTTGKLKRDPELPPYTAGVRYEVQIRDGNP